MRLSTAGIYTAAAWRLGGGVHETRYRQEWSGHQIAPCSRSGIRSLANALARRPEEGYAETAGAGSGVTSEQPTARMGLTSSCWLRYTLQFCRLQVIGGNFL